MAVSLKASGNWAGPTVGDSSHSIVFGSPTADDRWIIWVVWKPYTVSCQIPGFTEIVERADGTTGAGSGTGSVKVAAYYKAPAVGDGSATIDFSSSPAPAAFCAQLWQKDPGDVWDTPVYVDANWNASSDTLNASSTTNISDGAVVICCLGIRDDSATFARGTTAINASGVTFNGNYVESPATHFSTTTSNDLAADLGHRLVTVGAAAQTLTTTATLSASETGSAVWVVQGLVPPAPTDTGGAFFLYP